MARKDNSPSISFFSFQDIITSVTGIMFLVMLILTLMLLLRDMSNTAPGAGQDNSLREMQETIAQLRNQILDITNSSQRLQERIAELKKLDAKTIPQRLQALLQQVNELEQQSTSLRKEQQKTQEQILQLEQEIAQLQPELLPLEEKMQEVTAAKDSLEQQMLQLEEETKKSSRMMRFTWAKSISQKPLLVECDKNFIRIGNYNSSTPSKEFTSDGSDYGNQQMLGEFLTWTNNHPANDFYFILLAKPGAFEYVEALSILLDKKGYQRGREVLPDDEVIIFEPLKP